MNKKALGIVILIVLLLGVGGYLMMNKDKGASLTSTVQNAVDNATETATGSIKDLMSKGVSQSCTFSSDQNGYKSEGIIYVSGNKMRGDFTSTTSGKETISHMIVDNNTTYMWTQGEKNGFKMTYDPKDSNTIIDSTQTTQSTIAGSFDTEADMDYKCSAWIVDSSKLIPPTDVTFMSFGDIQKGMTLPSSYPSY